MHLNPLGKLGPLSYVQVSVFGIVFTSSWLEVSLPSHLGLFLSILLIMLLHYTRQWLQVRKIAVLRCAFRSDAEEIQY